MAPLMTMAANCWFMGVIHKAGLKINLSAPLIGLGRTA